jgi:hypothetical protein
VKSTSSWSGSDDAYALRGEIVNQDTDESAGFEAHIKPLFRERDRGSMQSHFDLWSYDDVSQHADAILARLQDGTMPCDGAWAPAQIDTFQSWIESGKPR